MICSKLREAERVFSSRLTTNTFPWTPLLSGCMLGWEGMNQVTYLKLEAEIVKKKATVVKNYLAKQKFASGLDEAFLISW